MTEETNVQDTPEKKLEGRIAAAQDRNRARSTVREVVEDHPIAVIAGGLLIGALLARFLPRSGLSRLGTKAATLAAAGAELASLYGAKAADTASEAAREGREKLGVLGESIGETAGEAKRRSIDLADVALAGARAVGGSAVRRVTDLASKVRH